MPKANTSPTASQLFLAQAVALSFRQTVSNIDQRKDFLCQLDYRIQECAKEFPKELNLLPDDHIEFQMFADLVRRHLLSEELALVDPPYGPTQ